jgi:leukotriene-A4 hydrolase
MSKAKYLLLIALHIAASGCEKDKPKESSQDMLQDPHSYASPVDARVTHLSWKAKINFDSKIISATAVWDIENHTSSDLIIFDTKDLNIQKITLNESAPAQFRLAEKDSLLGQALAVMIRPDTKKVSITYQTSPSAEAVQWLQPSQTAGKIYPFMFTQSQAILARSWIPCQDSPSIRFTYDADVTVDKEFLPLMSASNPQEKNSMGVYHFTMAQPIPSYLLALTVGDIRFKPISARTGIYAEPAILEKAVWEFEDLEKMVAGAEELYGKYQWERYDVIVLPPSFPFGGMENPRLTFATPTILAGDRSLTSLIAHELAHSWSGNLVTNATWNDFWLNEGFTVYFEHRIMEKLYGKDYSEMLAQLSLQDLHETIKELKDANKYADTKLKLDLTGRNPDDGVTDIAYNKGYFFLRSIEEKYGRDKFDAFLKNYFAQHAFTSMNTDGFINAIRTYYHKDHRIELDPNIFQQWIFTEGLPDDCPNPQSKRFQQPEDAVARWKSGQSLSTIDTRKWSTHEWLHFLKNLPDTLTEKRLRELDSFGNFTESGNAEITTLWLVHAIRNDYKTAYPKLEQFLTTVGRRKFLSPLYGELTKKEQGKKMAKEIYLKARPNYHYVATNTFDRMLN